MPEEDSEMSYVGTLSCVDAFSEVIPSYAWKHFQPDLIGSLTGAKKWWLQKMISKDVSLKDLAAEEELSTLTALFDPNGDSMTQNPNRIRWRLFDEDQYSVFSKASFTSRN